MAGIARKHLGPASYLGTGRWSLICALMFSMLVFALAVPSASAGRGIGYCKVDPVLVIDGRVADVLVGVPYRDLGMVNGPTEFVVSTPVGVDGDLAITALGFGYGETVHYEESHSLQVTSEGIEVRIKVRVPASSDSVPVLVEFAPNVLGLLQPTWVEGSSNQWISLRSLL